MGSAYYVYAIFGGETQLPPALLGLGGAPVTAVEWYDLAAAASCLEDTPLRPTSEHILRHEAVVEAVRRAGPALPVRFGTLLAGQGAVQRALKEHYASLLADLARLGDKVELGLTVLWNGAEGGAGATIEDAGAHDSRLVGTGPGTRYLRARLAEHRWIARWEFRAKTLAQAIHEALKCRASESHYTLLPAPRLLLRGAYLVQPAGVGAFREAFEAVRRAQPELRFLLSGPWPPYSFVTPPGDRSATCRDIWPSTRDSAAIIQPTSEEESL